MLAALFVSACSSTPTPDAMSPVQGQMLTHFALALQLRAHATAGDLVRFRSTARALSELEPTPDLPAEIFLQFGPLRYEAEVGSEARTNEAAAQAAAEIARTCGECHAANGIDVSAATAPAPRQNGTAVATHMDGLARVTGLLWAGLVGPDEERWQQGSQGLIDAGALPRGLSAQVSQRDLEFASDRLRRLGREAADAHEPGYRVRALAEIWGTCSECHDQLDGG